MEYLLLTLDELALVSRSERRLRLEYVLGIDGGGTKTACLISDTEGRLLSSGTGRSSNYLRVGPKEAKQSIQTAIQKGVQKCGVEIPKFKVAYLGMAGAGRPSPAGDRTELGGQHGGICSYERPGEPDRI